MNEAAQEPVPHAWLWIVALAALGLLVGLGRLDLWAPDEARLAQIAEELRQSGALTRLTLGGEPYDQKPPLYYALVAALSAPFGAVSEWSARAPSALAGIGSVALCAAIAARLFGRRCGWLAAGILLTSHRFWWLARRAQLDVLLTLFELVAVLAFVRLEAAAAKGAERRRLHLALHASLGLAALVKGPVAWLPLLGMIALRCWQGRSASLRELLAPQGLCLLLAPLALWLAAAIAQGPPGFFQSAVVDNFFGRIASGTSHVRPLYYYLGQLPIDFLPWSLGLPWVLHTAWRRCRSRDDTDAAAWRWLVCWFGTAFVVLSLSAGKRGLYLLPFFPALAIGSAAVLDAALRDAPERARRLLRAASWATLAVALMASAAAASLGALWQIPATLVPAELQRALAGIAVAAGLCALALAALRRSSGPALGPRALAACIAGLALLRITADVGLAAFEPEKSPRRVAEAALAAAGGDPERPSGVYGERALTGALLFYSKLPGGRVVEVAEASAAREFALQQGPLVLAARKLGRIDPDGELRTVARLRSGRRELLVVRGPAR